MWDFVILIPDNCLSIYFFILKSDSAANRSLGSNEDKLYIFVIFT